MLCANGCEQRSDSSVMEMSPPDDAPAAGKGEVTRWLIAGSAGDAAAIESLLPVVYDELHRQAAELFRRERPGHTLQPTVLVSEAYLRLFNQDEITWQNRAQFFAIAAKIMRRILVNHARTRQAEKRGGGAEEITLVDDALPAPQRAVNLLALDDALQQLETVDPEKSRMVELRFFSGLSVEETATVMGVSPRTIDRQWRTARAWLQKEISKVA